MATQSTYTLALEYGEDERMMYLRVSDGTTFAVLSLLDAVEACTAPGADEPDYDELAMTVVEMVGVALDDNDFETTDVEKLYSAALGFVSPGPGYELEDVQFVVRKRTRLTSQMDLTPDCRSATSTSVRTSDNSFLVRVELDDPFGEGDRATDLPTIVMTRGHSWTVRMTWLEARKLAAALNEVVDTAELG